MAHDPLAAFRAKQPGAIVPPVSSLSPAPANYSAFTEKDRAERVEITLNDEAARSPRYSDLVDVVFDGKRGTHIVLAYYTLVVIISGRNLQSLVKALQNGQAETICLFDSEKWPTLAEGATCIDSIVFKPYPDGLEYIDAVLANPPS